MKADRAPFRLLLGTDAVKIVRDEFQGRIDEIDAWAPVSVTTDFAGEANAG
ncbi:short chain dehydrogenase [Amycolatopsis sp. M39]|nr:short chain dehydrogenase [Amycolatopsis sp. M39]